jgi:sigma-B regulation protein RsbU (phosphoserine phosphatase)
MGAIGGDMSSRTRRTEQEASTANDREPGRIQGLLDELNGLRDQRDNLVRLARLSTVINSNLDLGTLLGLAIGIAKELVQAEAASLLLEEESGDLVFKAAEGLVGDKVKETYRLPRGSGVAAWVAEHGEKVRIPDVYRDPRFSPELDEKTGYRTVSMLAVPLRVKGRTIGVVQAINKWDESGGTREILEFSDADLDLFSLFCDQVAVAVETARLYQASLQQQRLDMDLSVAREIQQSFLPARFPPVHGYMFAAHNEPALRIGGDFYDVFALGDGRLGMALGDVCGKGISAALYMARLLSELRADAIEHATPARVLETLNRRLCERSPQGMFVTLYYAVLDPVNHRLQYALAGHHEPLLLQRDGTPVFLPHTGGIPLALDRRRPFEERDVRLEPGQTVLAYTDGVVESTDREGRLFGRQEMLRHLCSDPARTENPHTVVRTVLDGARRHAGMTPIRDDITLLAMKRADETVP